MTQLAQLPIFDITHELPRRDWIIGTRPATDSITLHWNGPTVAQSRQRGAGLIEQLIADSNWQMRPGWGNTKNGAPHLMYGYVVDTDGVIYRTARPDEMLWHCAHQVGNSRGLAIHFPIGEGQDVTPWQWTVGLRLVEALRQDYNVVKKRVFGHLEWTGLTKCPGPRLMGRLLAYRGNTPAPAPTVVPGLRKFRVIAEDGLKIRQGPAKAFPEAGKLKFGQTFWVDVIKPNGERVDGNPNWAHMAFVAHEQADVGFLSMRWLEEVR